MALGRQMGTFTFRVTSTTHTSTTVEVNYEGSMRGDLSGSGEGTLTVPSVPGAKSGTWSWNGASYLDNGDIIGAVSQGMWEAIGTHRWRLHGSVNFSDGRMAGVEAEATQATRSLVGTLYEWS